MYDRIKQRLESGETLAVATIVSTIGSTPREIGAKMVVTASGDIMGTIGGGCGEAEVRREAIQSIRTRRPALVKVELTDDIASNSPAVCGGVLDAFIDPWDPEDTRAGCRELITPLTEISSRGEAAVLVTLLEADGIEGAAPGDKCLVRDGSVLAGNIVHPELLRGILKEAAVRLELEQSRRITIEPGGTGGRADLFFDVITAMRRAVIVGAGHLAIPLVRFTKTLGYHVTVLDDRVVYANRERFPEADAVLVGDMAETLGGMDITPQTYIVLITRGHQYDEPCLRKVLDSPARYIGMIGSRRRIQACFLRFRDEEGIPEERLRRVHAPIGLDIGAESPEEIALAIAAEMVKVRRGGKALSRAGRQPD